MPLFRPLIQRLPSKARHGMALVIMGVTMIVFGILFVYQHFFSPTLPVIQSPEQMVLTHIAAQKIVPEGHPRFHQLTVDEMDFFLQSNSSFYEGAIAGDWVVTYPTEIFLYRSIGDEVIRAWPIKW